MSKELQNIIEELISTKKEDVYYDFKKEWHDNTVDLIRDIICFANCEYNGNRYLIFGIDEENFDKGEYIIGVSSQKRVLQADLINSLRKAGFADGVFPDISIHTFIINDKEIDIVEIKNINEKPYYLEKHYLNKNEKDTRTDDKIFEESLRKSTSIPAGTIFTRIKDTNTPKNQVASSNQIEHMWKERFGLTLSIIDRFKIYLQDVGSWSKVDNDLIAIDDDEHEDGIYFYNKFPEFKIKLSQELNSTYGFPDHSYINCISATSKFYDRFKSEELNAPNPLPAYAFVLEYFGTPIYTTFQLNLYEENTEFIWPDTDYFHLNDNEKFKNFSLEEFKKYWEIEEMAYEVLCFESYNCEDIKPYITYFLYQLNTPSNFNHFEDLKHISNQGFKEFSSQQKALKVLRTPHDYLPFIFFKSGEERQEFKEYVYNNINRFTKERCSLYKPHITPPEVFPYPRHQLVEAFFAYWMYEEYHLGWWRDSI